MALAKTAFVPPWLGMLLHFKCVAFALGSHLIAVGARVSFLPLSLSLSPFSFLLLFFFLPLLVCVLRAFNIISESFIIA